MHNTTSFSKYWQVGQLYCMCYFSYLYYSLLQLNDIFIIPQCQTEAKGHVACTLLALSPPCFPTITCVMDNNVKKQIPHTEQKKEKPCTRWFAKLTLRRPGVVNSVHKDQNLRFDQQFPVCMMVIAGKPGVFWSVSQMPLILRE